MNRQYGFTLIETVIFIIVLGIALSGIVSLFVESAVGGRYPYDQQRAIAIANTYMDEILRKRWDESVPFGGGCVETGSGYCDAICAARVYPGCGTCTLDIVNSVCVAPGAVVPPAIPGPDGAEARATFDDIDDYHNPAGDSPPQDATGIGIGNYAGYTVVVLVSTPGADWNGVPASDTKQIVVTVSHGTDSYSLTAYRVNN